MLIPVVSLCIWLSLSKLMILDMTLLTVGNVEASEPVWKKLQLDTKTGVFGIKLNLSASLHDITIICFPFICAF